MSNDRERVRYLKEVLRRVPDSDAIRARKFIQFEHASDNEIVRILHTHFEELRVSHPDYARLLTLRYQKDWKMGEITTKYYAGKRDKANREWDKALVCIDEILTRNHDDFVLLNKKKQFSRLPPKNYDELFGVTNLVEDVRVALVEDKEPWIIALSGIGGAGKTSIADAVARKAIEDAAFEDVIWVRAAPQSMSQKGDRSAISDRDLIVEIAKVIGSPTRAKDFVSEEKLVKAAFADKRMLLVLDNLETLRDINSVLELLNHLAKPSKILITAREFPMSLAMLGVRRIPVNELGFDDASAVLIHHANMVGGATLTQAVRGQAEDIFDKVGGSPHALKLVASLASNVPIDVILQDLPNWNMSQIDALYQYIYRKIWEVLSAEAKDFLGCMPLISETGATLARIKKMSGLQTSITNIVQDLITYGLLEKRGNLDEPRYGIHRLTKTFLLKEIIDW